VVREPSFSWIRDKVMDCSATVRPFGVVKKYLCAITKMARYLLFSLTLSNLRLLALSLCGDGVSGGKMKKLTLALTFLLAIAAAGEAGAALVSFSETYLGNAGDATMLNISGSTYSFIFDLAAAGNAANYYQRSTGGATYAPTSDASGFVPADMTITSALLYYTLYDTDNQKDSATIQTGASDGNLSIANYTGSSRLDLKAGQTAQSFIYTFAPAAYTWLADGKLALSINSSDSIRLDQLRLEVQAQVAYQAQPVPLPSAGWFLGAGLIGMVGIRRKSLA